MKCLIYFIILLFTTTTIFSAVIMETDLDSTPENWEKVCAVVVHVKKIDLITNSKIKGNDFQKPNIYKINVDIIQCLSGPFIDSGTKVDILTDENLINDNNYFMLLNWDDDGLILGVYYKLVIGSIVNYLQLEKKDLLNMTDLKQIVEISKISLISIKSKIIDDYLSKRNSSNILLKYLVVTNKKIIFKQYDDYILNLMEIIQDYKKYNPSTIILIDQEINNKIFEGNQISKNYVWLTSHLRLEVLNYLNEQKLDVNDLKYVNVELTKLKSKNNNQQEPLK